MTPFGLFLVGLAGYFGIINVVHTVPSGVYTRLDIELIPVSDGHIKGCRGTP
jgi:hypothetical protein